MRLLVVWLIALVLLCLGGVTVQAQVAPSQADVWGPVSQGFQVQLAGPTAPSAGPVMLRCTLQNATAETRLISVSYPEFDYKLTLADAYGNVIRTTDYAFDVTRRLERELQPGEALTSDYNLTAMYGMLADGEYTAVAKRYVLRLDGEGTDQVVSNPVAITVASGQMSRKALPAARPSPAAKTQALRWGAVSEGFVLAVEGLSPSGPSRPNAAATRKLRFVLKNVSGRSLRIVVSYPEHEYRLTVTGPGGDLLAPRPDVGVVTRRMDQTVKPGEQIVEEYDLAQAYRLKKDGRYRIEPHRSVPRLDGKGWAQVTAPPITVRVAHGQVVAVPREPQRGGR